MNPTILIVEDDYDILGFLIDGVKSHGFNPIGVSNGIRALQLYEQEYPDLILLDVQLPDLTGFEICEEIRKISNVPIIFVSCLDDGSDIIRGLELGGDDYVTKPFDLLQLIARIKSNLRRAPVFNRQWFADRKNTVLDSKSLTIGNVTIDFHLQRVTINGKNIPLTNKEFFIFSILAQHPEKTFNANELYKLVWGTDSLGETRTLKVHISNLRNKLQAFGHTSMIRNVRGVGYQFCLDE